MFRPGVGILHVHLNCYYKSEKWISWSTDFFKNVNGSRGLLGGCTWQTFSVRQTQAYKQRDIESKKTSGNISMIDQ